MVEPCSESYGFCPCSNSVGGSIFLMVVYGAIVLGGARWISIGSERLLELLDAGLIGSLVLPIVQAVPDTAIVTASVVGGSKQHAQRSVQAGFGALAGASISLLTIVFGAATIVGRCDLDANGQAIDKRLTKGWHPKLTGVTTDRSTKKNAAIMAASTLLFLIPQVPDFWGDSQNSRAMLAGMVFCFATLGLYIIYQLLSPRLQRRRARAVRGKFLKMSAVRMMHRLARRPLLDKLGNVDEEALRVIFRRFDKGGDGHIDGVELRALVTGMTFGATGFITKPEDLDFLVEQFGQSSDSRISQQAFVEGMATWIQEHADTWKDHKSAHRLLQTVTMDQTPASSPPTSVAPSQVDPSDIELGKSTMDLLRLSATPGNTSSRPLQSPRPGVSSPSLRGISSKAELAIVTPSPPYSEVSHPMHPSSLAGHSMAALVADVTKGREISPSIQSHLSPPLGSHLPLPPVSLPPFGSQMSPQERLSPAVLSPKTARSLPSRLSPRVGSPMDGTPSAVSEGATVSPWVDEDADEDDDDDDDTMALRRATSEPCALVPRPAEEVRRRRKDATAAGKARRAAVWARRHARAAVIGLEDPNEVVWHGDDLDPSRLKVGRLRHRRGKQKGGDSSSSSSSSSSDSDDGHEKRVMTREELLARASLYLLAGTVVAALFSEPLISAIDSFSQASSIPSFFVSFVVAPLSSCGPELYASLYFARKKRKKNIALTFASVFGATTMNNTMALGSLLGLMAFRGLTWQFTSEVITIVTVSLVIGSLGFSRQTFLLWTAYVVIAMYPMSMALVVVLKYGFNLS